MPSTMVSRLVAGARRVAHDLEPECMEARDAVELLAQVTEGERLFAGMRTLLMERIDRSGIWKANGHRSAAHLLAATTGISIGAAVGVVETARRLRGLSATEEELRAGRLSDQQAREITAAASEAPHAERALLDRAHEDGYAGLRQHAAQVRANASSAEQERARYERIHRTRHVRWWVDDDGAERGEWKLTADAGARLRAGIRAEQDRIFKTARTDGRREPAEAYAADALVALVDRNRAGSNGSAHTHRVIWRVDASALERGTTQGDEVCEIAGVGPVPVALAREVVGDAFLDIVITKGVDVLNVTHVGRTRLAAVQTALDWLYTECGVFDCHQREHLHYHHTEPYRETKVTKLSELVPLCPHMHDLVEHRGFSLRRRPDGQYDLIPPDGGRAPP